MGSSLGYIVAEPGSDFRRLLRRPVSDETLEELTRTDSLVDAELANNDQEFLIELTGCVSIIWLPYRTSSVAANMSIQQRIESWEAALVTICHSEILRIDESALESCPAFSDFWFRNLREAKSVLEWMRKQPSSQTPDAGT